VTQTKKLPDTQIEHHAQDEEIAHIDGDIITIESEKLDQIVEAVTKRVTRVVQAQSFSGPIPPPRMLQQYDEVHPGFAKIIVDEFASNGHHVRTQEAEALRNAIRRDDENRASAKHLVWGAFALIAILAYTSHDGVAIAVAVTTVVAIIGGFLGKKITPTNDRTTDGE
jgi:uncharacterized membrane protein